jgi:MoaA/NifB/PqqE/SkfB family radical SAM enzyme/GT2 family glycosyltransferase
MDISGGNDKDGNEEQFMLLLELLDSGDEALDYLVMNLNGEYGDAYITIIDSLGELYENITAYVERNNLDEPNRTLDAAMNATLATEKLRKICFTGDIEKSTILLIYELIPLHVFLKNELNFWFAVYPDTNKIHKQRDEILSNLKEYAPVHKEAMEMDYAYDVSIMVLCFNKVHLTKIALESLLKYTDFDKLGVEIILINNGSDDNGETTAYLGEINDTRIKTVDLKYPLGYNGYSLGPFAAQGRYFVEFHTDVIATENWLESLLFCISSDPCIGAAVATCNESANSQAITVSYADPMIDDTEMQAFAREYNKSDPKKWEQRVRLMPTSGYITPTIIYRQLLRDPWLYYGWFTDDDMSTFLRRSGFKQILAKDTFLHHFGSQTSSMNLDTSGNVEKMRRRYFEKWGIDAWYGMHRNTLTLDYIFTRNIEGSETFLFIDPLFGSNPMYISDRFTACGKEIGETAAIITDPDYFEEAGYHYDIVLKGNINESLAQLDKKFDYILFQTDITEYINKDFPEMLEALHKVCNPDARVIFAMRNPSYYGNFDLLANVNLSSNLYEPWVGLHFIDPEYVTSAAKEKGFSCSVLGMKGKDIKEHELVIKYLKVLAHDEKKAENMVFTRYVYALSPIIPDNERKDFEKSHDVKPFYDEAGAVDIGKVAIVGTHQFGEALMRKISSTPDMHSFRLTCFCDSTGQYNEKTLHGFENVKLKQLAKMHQDGKIDKIIVAYSGHAIELPSSKVFRQLRDAGITEGVYTVPPWYYDGAYDYVQYSLAPFDRENEITLNSALIKADMSKDVLDFIMPVSNLHCNSSCKSCVTASPLVEREFTTLKSYKNDIRRLKELYWHVSRFRITGGEPLLHPDISEMVEIAREAFPATGLAIQSNGNLILKNDGSLDGLFEVMKKNRCGFQISTYMPVYKRRDELDMILKRHGIQWHWGQISGQPIEEFNICRMLTPVNDMEQQHRNCRGNKHCHTLLDGYIYPCFMPVSAKVLENYYGVEFKEMAGNIDKMRINIYDTKLDGMEIVEFLTKPSPACEYCCFEKERNEKWEQCPRKDAKLEDFVLV